jgi:NADPH-dependent curcumin reductase CurA
MTNHAWVISKPNRGGYNSDCLHWEEREVSPLNEGEVLVRTLLLSLDPTSLNWLKLDPSYTFLPLAVGDVMLGAAVGVVEESRSAGFTKGDLVQGMWGWELYSNARPGFLKRIRPAADVPLEAYLSIFSHVGHAAAAGMIEVGALKPTDTVVVSGAAGATGSLAAQIAKAHGARVIGIAGGEVKCRLLIDTFKLDGAIDYKAGDLVGALAKECPQGVDLFFDNVGGLVLDAVLANMAMGARIVICGAMSQYNLADPKDAYGCKNLPLMLFRRARMEGFLGSAGGREAEFEALLHRLYAQGQLLNRSHIIDGLENAPQALQLLLTGQNDGKLMVRVSQ